MGCAFFFFRLEILVGFLFSIETKHMKGVVPNRYLIFLCLILFCAFSVVDAGC